MTAPDCGDVVAGRYRLLKLLGEGGISKVFLAADLKLSGKRWAIKVTAGGEAAGVDAEEEAHLLTALNHHRLPTIIDFVADPLLGCDFLVMDYVDGRHLDQYASDLKQRLTAERLAVIGMQICEGLSYLHGLDPPIIHRDLKPSNLMVDASGDIRFIDFGISRRYSIHRDEDTVKLGTIGFAAPEQYGGSQSDARSDLYSLGAVLLYLATEGQHSFWCEKAEQLIGRRGLSSLNPVLSKLLAQEKEERYESADQTYFALRSILQNSSQQPSSGSGRGHRSSVAASMHRPLTIAVMSAFPGAGSTHTSILLAHTLAQLGFETAVIETDSKASDFRKLAAAAIEEGLIDEQAESARAFSLEGVEYLSSPSRAERLELLTSDRACIVFDQGESRSKEELEEFARADLAIWIEGAGVWRRAEAEFHEICPAAGRRGLVCVIPFASERTVKRMRRLKSPVSVYALPAEDNPFQPGVEAIEAACELLKLIFPMIGEPVKRSGSFARLRQRWKGRM
ncbi:serine/threonine protein kinase [Paenibacillus brevis]|uniref:non-specific serine/threonine protein kinase n=1 Tax=Paenibacillus brevis TaxID=2841508 RepID=A0ABS6FQI0_9BACL|nr:serine/threonine-protein kinase [Paenibacillus brevis]MBU5672490.1 protein kinase [Paenibacillus brevis]